MPGLSINSNQPTYAHELWNAVKEAPPKEIYQNQDYLMVFSTKKGNIHPEAYRSLHAPDILQGIKGDRALITYSTEEKVEALRALQLIQKGLQKRCETVADQIKLFISKILNYIERNEWVDDITLEDKQYEKAIQDLSEEIDEDVRQAYADLKVQRLKESLGAAVPAKIDRNHSKKATLARLIQSQVQGNKARKIYTDLKAQAAQEKEKSIVALASESPAKIEPIQKPQLPKLVFTDDQIEGAPCHYAYDKNDPIAAGEYELRRKGELVGKNGRSLRQLFRCLAKRVPVVSLTGVQNAFNDYCITLKQEVVGTFDKRKVKLPSKIYFEIETSDKKKVIHFKNNFQFPDIEIDGDSVNGKSYQKACYLLGNITWK